MIGVYKITINNIIPKANGKDFPPLKLVYFFIFNHSLKYAFKGIKKGSSHTEDPSYYLTIACVSCIRFLIILFFIVLGNIFIHFFE
jgi:hypothetical protein